MKIRDLADDDIPALKVWLDRAHGGKVKVDVFFGDGKQARVIEDSRGPVFFVLLTDVKRVDIQFDPFEENGFRTAKALALLDKDLQGEELVTESVAPKFIGFLDKMRFKAASGTFVRRK